ncbi:hypothetical protein ACTNDG_07370 [Clostridium sp. HCP1S3_B4]|uniref:hypothetical protein n=1 Tax=unclassified Clostridium TaxID=2614128 RepID=UPI002A79AEB7|nr:hypothetical protein [Clostridiales bacterium]MDY2728830.1 hypothetical protein [Clostridium sp.]
MKNKINVVIHYPNDMSKLADKISEVLIDIFVKKFDNEQLTEFIKVLQDNKKKIKL